MTLHSIDFVLLLTLDNSGRLLLDEQFSSSEIANFIIKQALLIKKFVVYCIIFMSSRYTHVLTD